VISTAIVYTSLEFHFSFANSFRLGPGAIADIAIGSLVGVALILLTALSLFRRCRSSPVSGAHTIDLDEDEVKDEGHNDISTPMLTPFSPAGISSATGGSGGYTTSQTQSSRDSHGFSSGYPADTL
jgi:hypothetical protein